MGLQEKQFCKKIQNRSILGVVDKTDDELILEYRTGSEEAFKILIERYTTPLYGFAYRMTNKSDLSEDIVAETCVKVWKTISRYKTGNNTFKSWIFTITRNTTIDNLRKKKMPVVSDFDTTDGHNYLMETVGDADTLPSTLIEKAEQKHLLNSALASLSVEDREILTLHNLEEMTFEAIGEVIKKPLNTVKSKYRRALAKLRIYLEKHDR